MAVIQFHYKQIKTTHTGGREGGREHAIPATFLNKISRYEHKSTKSKKMNTKSTYVQKFTT